MKKIERLLNLKNESFEESGFSYGLFVFVLLEAISVVFSYLNDLYIDTLCSIVIFCTSLAILFLPPKKRLQRYWVFYMIALLSISMLWFARYGSRSGINYYYIPLILYTLIITPPKQHLYYLTPAFILISVLYFLEIKYPNLIKIPSIDQDTLYIDSVFAYGMLFIALVFGVSFLKRSFDKQRTLVTQKNKELERLYKERTDFFINLTHEIRTPVTLIANYLEKFVEKHSPDKELEVASVYVEKLKRDIVNFMDTAKIEHSKMLYQHNELTDFSRVAEDCLSIFQPWAASQKVELQWTIEPGLTVQADASALSRIVENLLENAVKYNKENGKVEVSLAKKGEYIELTITDTGIGMNHEELQNIFSPYYQADHPKLNSQGLGLGLPLVKGVVEELKGSIEVDSHPDLGTKVLVRLQASEKETSGTLIDHQTKVGLHLSEGYPVEQGSSLDKEKGIKPTILVVEDNIEMLAYLVNELSEEYNIVAASNGKEAWSRLDRGLVPDLILSDIMMDEIDGLELIERIQGKPALVYVPIAFITARGSEINKLEGLKAGVWDYIVKPFSRAELLMRVRTLLQLVESQKKLLLHKVERVLSNQVEEDPRDKWTSFNERCEHYHLSKRETEIASLMIEGVPYKEIAERLYISSNTVSRHISNIFGKLEVNSKMEVVKKLL